MAKWLSRLRRRLPRRRRRLWRYVSGRRHGAGVAVFALLVLMAYGYWHLTNDVRIQRKVEQYLAGLTGGRVEVDRARFSLFSEIRVEGLRLYLGEKADIPFFKGDVVLGHHPWGLIRGRLEPTEIVSVGPEVALVRDVETGQWQALRALSRAGRGNLLGRKMRFPPIRLREGRLQIIEMLDGQALRRPKVPLSAGLVPDPHGKTYKITFEDEAGSIRGGGTIDAVTGRTLITARPSEAGLDRTLPKQYLDWKKRHKLTFSEPWAISIALGGPATASGPAARDRMTVTLKDVSMELPPEEGGLRLTGVGGELTCDASGVRISRLSGRIVDAGEAAFSLAGRYHGYEATSPFEISLEVSRLRLPVSQEAAGAWGDAVARFHEQLAPAGPIDVRADLKRDEHGKVHVTGLAELRGVAVRLPYWPIRVEQMTGQIALAGDRLEFRGLRGRHGRSPVEISGWLADPLGRATSDIRISARDLPFSQEVRDGLPEGYRGVWDALSPRGRAHFEVHLRGGEKRSVAVAVELAGEASMEYSRFPYRLEGLTGELYVDSQGAQIRSVRGKSGTARCVLNGKTGPVGGGREFEVFLEVADLPLDERLAAALPQSSRAAYQACGLSGRADVTGAVIRRQKDQPVDFEIPIALKDATIRHRLFPYLLDKATGTVTLTPRQVAIQHLLAGHGRARIIISGRTPLADDLRGCDLKGEATGLTLDAELRRALPEAARRGWDLLAPEGTADATVRFRMPPSGKDLPADYHLVLRPRDMLVRCRYFPYPLRLASGRAVVQPGKLILEAIGGRAGSADVSLAGEVLTGSAGEQADLRVTTGPVRIDKQLLAALPAGLTETLGLRPGGTVALALKRLKIGAGGGATSRPEASTRSFQVIRPASTAPRPGGGVAWEWSGRMVFNEAVMDLGLGIKRFTGAVEGQMSCAGPPEDLSAAADVILDDLDVGSRRLGKFTARLAKRPSSPILRVDNISGKAYGGRVAGRAEVRLAPPRKYGLSLMVEDLDLASLVASGSGDTGRQPDVRGLLTGNLQLTATVGQPASRRGKGELRIARARLQKLPILLGFLHVINLTLPGQGPFNAADVHYYLEGNKLVLREIYLSGSVLSMLGAGKINTQTETLDLTFLTGPARKLPRLASPLRELLQGIAGQLMTVRVTGTLGEPKVQTIPLRNLDKTLRELYNPAGQ